MKAIRAFLSSTLSGNSSAAWMLARNTPKPARAAAEDKLRAVIGKNGEEDGGHDAGAGQNDPDGQHVREHLPSLLVASAHSQLARAGDRQAGVADPVRRCSPGP